MTKTSQIKRDARNAAWPGATREDAVRSCRYHSVVNKERYIDFFMEEVSVLEEEQEARNAAIDEREAKLDRIEEHLSLDFTDDQRRQIRDAFGELLDIIEEQS